MSLSNHVCGMITNCTQALYAPRVVHAHSMRNLVPQIIFQSVIVTKLLYASSARWGFINLSKQHSQHIFVLQYSLRTLPGSPRRRAAICNHVLLSLLPPPIVALQNYDLRSCTQAINFTFSRFNGMQFSNSCPILKHQLVKNYIFKNYLYFITAYVANFITYIVLENCKLSIPIINDYQY